jgi:hypothetical protein
MLGVRALRLWFRGLADSVGSMKYNAATDTYTITASGADIWDTLDQFHYAYKQLTGDSTFIARIDGVRNTNNLARAGIMIREDLDTNSAFAAAYISADNRVVFEYRTSKGADMSDPDSRTNTVADVNVYAPPHWIKLTRSGDSFSVQDSANGTTWQEITPETEGDPTSLTIQMNPTVYVGLAVTARSADSTCKAQIYKFSATGTVSPVGKITTSKDIGIASNDAEPLYVTVEDAANSSWTVIYPDANAVQSTTWQEWNIDLKEFSDATPKVDLKNVKKMYIGTGSKTNPVPGGTGSLYIDDIRLYIPDCVPSMAKPAADLDDDCTVGYLDLQTLTNNWLISAYDVTPAAPSTANLVASYAFENNLQDGSGHGNNGDPCSAPVYVAGKVGSKSLEFDGVNDAVVTHRSLLNNVTQFTLAGWVSAVNADASRVGLFGQNDCIEFGFDSGDIMAWTSGGGQASRAWGFANNTWHHVAAVGDGTTVKVYVDGEIVASGGTAVSADYGTSTYGFSIGGSGVWDSTGNWFEGQLDEVRVYSRALSQAEIGSLAGKTAVYSQPLQWLLEPQDSGIDMNSDGRISLKDYAKLAQGWLEELLWP